MTTIKYLYFRLIFALKYFTFNKCLVKKDDLIIPTSNGIFSIYRFCPHQNAPLENAYISNNVIQCHWHGCKLLINKKGYKI